MPKRDPFAAIRVQFLEKLESEADRVDALLAEMEMQSAPYDLALMAQISTIAHKISGVAATLGFEDLGAAAAKLDMFISSRLYLLPENTTMAKEMVAMFLQELDFALEQGPSGQA